MAATTTIAFLTSDDASLPVMELLPEKTWRLARPRAPPQDGAARRPGAQAQAMPRDGAAIRLGTAASGESNSSCLIPGSRRSPTEVWRNDRVAKSDDPDAADPVRPDGLRARARSRVRA